MFKTFVSSLSGHASYIDKNQDSKIWGKKMEMTRPKINITNSISKFSNVIFHIYHYFLSPPGTT